LLEEGKPPALT